MIRRPKDRSLKPRIWAIRSRDANIGVGSLRQRKGSFIDDQRDQLARILSRDFQAGTASFSPDGKISRRTYVKVLGMHPTIIQCCRDLVERFEAENRARGLR
jgi:hypothetical protein